MYIYIYTYTQREYKMSENPFGATFQAESLYLSPVNEMLPCVS